MADAVHELRDLDFQVTMVTRTVHANSANLAGGGGALEAKIIFDPGLNLRTWEAFSTEYRSLPTACQERVLLEGWTALGA